MATCRVRQGMQLVVWRESVTATQSKLIMERTWGIDRDMTKYFWHNDIVLRPDIYRDMLYIVIWWVFITKKTWRNWKLMIPCGGNDKYIKAARKWTRMFARKRTSSCIFVYSHLKKRRFQNLVYNIWSYASSNPNTRFKHSSSQTMAPLKIIGAGFGRTGTLSLCYALDMLG